MSSNAKHSLNPAALIRLAFGGILMGLANLVPGISGGTMLLATGVYKAFITAIADVTRLKLSVSTIITLAIIVFSAVAAIGLGAGIIKDLVVNQRWIMYALFIGLTLGGVPVVYKLARPINPNVIFGAIAGIAVMAVLAFAGTGGSGGSGFGMLTLAGVAGAAAMVLPGISGGYLLLLLGQYVPILGSIDRLKDALKDGDTAAAIAEWTTVVPVGLGVVIGVVVVANAVRFFLTKFEKPTLGVLIGLLLGSVLGLYPFQQPATPTLGDTLKGRTVVSIAASAEGDIEVTGQLTSTAPDGSSNTITELIGPEDWDTETFTPSMLQIFIAFIIMDVGIFLTLAISVIAPDEEKDEAKESAGSGD